MKLLERACNAVGKLMPASQPAEMAPVIMGRRDFFKVIAALALGAAGVAACEKAFCERLDPNTVKLHDITMLDVNSSPDAQDMKKTVNTNTLEIGVLLDGVAAKMRQWENEGCIAKGTLPTIRVFATYQVNGKDSRDQKLLNTTPQSQLITGDADYTVTGTIPADREPNSSVFVFVEVLVTRKSEKDGEMENQVVLRTREHKVSAHPDS